MEKYRLIDYVVRKEGVVPPIIKISQPVRYQYLTVHVHHRSGDVGLSMNFTPINWEQPIVVDIILDGYVLKVDCSYLAENEGVFQLVDDKMLLLVHIERWNPVDEQGGKWLSIEVREYNDDLYQHWEKRYTPVTGHVQLIPMWKYRLSKILAKIRRGR